MNAFIRKSALLLLYLLAGTSMLYAQQAGVIPLYQVDSELEETGELPAYQAGRQYISLNNAVTQRGYLSAGDRLSLQTGEVTTTFQVQRVSQFTGDTRSVIARSGEDGRLLSFTIQGDRILGNVHLHDRGELYHMAWDPDRQSNYLAAINYGELDILTCPADRTMEVGEQAPGGIEGQDQEEPETGADSHTTIDLMVVYTDDAEDYIRNDRNSNPSLYISEMVNRSQMAMDESNVLIELNLVHTENTPYDEDSDNVDENGDGEFQSDEDNTSETLRRLTEPNDGHMDNVHQLRDVHQADMVTLFAHVEDVGGIAWILQSHSGSPAYAFSVNRVQQLYFTYTMAHELGHNMGNHHSRNQSSSPAPSEGGLNEYSTGWRWTGSDGIGYVSVMTYNEGDEETPHFSNPNISHQGQPTGSYSGQYAPADNVRSMNEIRGVIADYRQANPSGPPSAPIPSTPQNGEKEVSRTPNFTWSISTGADDYQLQVSTSSSFSSTVINRTTTSTNYRPQDPLQYLTTYYWRVRASNENGTSDWSSTFSFETVIAPPENVEVTGPADGTFQQPLKPTFTWDPSARAAQYQVQISTEEDFSSAVVSSNANGTSFMPVEDLEYATIYYWRVRATNAGGESDWSAGRSFTTVVDETKITMNYPNPFRDATTIKYQLAEPSDVLLEVYNTAGRRVRTLVDEQQQPRVYNYRFDGSGLASGVYIVRLLAGGNSYSHMMTLIK